MYHQSGPFPAPLTTKPALRFAVGDACVCLVPDASALQTVWLAGTVTAVWPERAAWPFGKDGTPAAAAYAITLTAPADAPCTTVVLCHRDDHTLVRDAALQPIGLAGVSSGDVPRFGKRKRDDGQWESIDQQTRKVRPAAAPAPPPAPAVAPAPAAAQSRYEAGSSSACNSDAETEPWLICGECEDQEEGSESNE